MAVSFSDLQLALEFVSSGGMGENEAYLDRQSGKIYWLQTAAPFFKRFVAVALEYQVGGAPEIDLEYHTGKIEGSDRERFNNKNCIDCKTYASR